MVESLFRKPIREKYHAEKDGGSSKNLNIWKQKKKYAMVWNQYKYVVQI